MRFGQLTIIEPSGKNRGGDVGKLILPSSASSILLST